MCDLPNEISRITEVPSSLQEGSGLAAYEKFLKNVAKFREYEDMSVELKFASDVNQSIFVENRAAWHKQCHTKFSNSKLDSVSQEKGKLITMNAKCMNENQKGNLKIIHYVTFVV